MLTHASEIWERYPNGAIVRDRLGNCLPGVVSCDLKTGEVISVVGFDDKGQLQGRRQFHPAPLTIEPKQWLHIGFG
jgi:hypothetical protein